jgi:hypothetical protein
LFTHEEAIPLQACLLFRPSALKSQGVNRRLSFLKNG